MRNFGFTLAEVLITLGIIGVVAAITIPNLISNYQKRVVETNLKETYSILQQAMKSAEADDIALDQYLGTTGMSNMKNWFNTYLAPYIKYNRVCYDKAGCWHTQKNKTLSGTSIAFDTPGIGIGSFDMVIVQLINGTNIVIDWYHPHQLSSIFGINSTIKSIALYIDANGTAPPNIIGKDIYAVVMTENGLISAGQDKSLEDINKNCSATATGNIAGMFCLAKVKNNGWTIPNDVWKKKIK